MLKGYVARDEDTKCEIGHQEKLGESYINGCVRAVKDKRNYEKITCSSYNVTYKVIYTSHRHKITINLLVLISNYNNNIFSNILSYGYIGSRPLEP